MFQYLVPLKLQYLTPHKLIGGFHFNTTFNHIQDSGDIYTFELCNLLFIATKEQGVMSSDDPDFIVINYIIIFNFTDCICCRQKYT